MVGINLEWMDGRFIFINKDSEVKVMPADYKPDSFGLSVYREYFKTSAFDKVAFWAVENQFYTGQMLRNIYQNMTEGIDYSLDVLEYTTLIFAYRVKAETLSFLNHNDLEFNHEGVVEDCQQELPL